MRWPSDAVLAQGLRGLLEKAGVPFQMPLAPAPSTSIPQVLPSSRRHGQRVGMGDDADGDVTEMLAHLNQGRLQEQPDSALGRQQQLASTDWQSGERLRELAWAFGS